MQRRVEQQPRTQLFHSSPENRSSTISKRFAEESSKKNFFNFEFIRILNDLDHLRLEPSKVFLFDFQRSLYCSSQKTERRLLSLIRSEITEFGNLHTRSLCAILQWRLVLQRLAGIILKNRIRYLCWWFFLSCRSERMRTTPIFSDRRRDKEEKRKDMVDRQGGEHWRNKETTAWTHLSVSRLDINSVPCADQAFPTSFA